MTKSRHSTSRDRRRRAVVLAVVGVAALGLASAGASAGLVLGYDPTGLWIWSALTETPIAEVVDLRAQVGFSTTGAAGLMLATASVVAHPTWAPFQPFVGVGAGAALTPPPFTTGLLVEGVGGLRVVAAPWLALLFQARVLVRWTDAGVTAGPLFEAGAEVRF
ncbi:MAG: hypothetical protein AB1778_07140 [Candidatus Bipolaricaulota bacterium]